jgi:hypothetical protein
MRMKMKHMVFLESVSFLPFALLMFTDAFGMTAIKSW